MRAALPAAASRAEVAGAFVAVQEYGARLRHALVCAQLLADAVDRQVSCDVVVRFPTAVAGEVVRSGVMEVVVDGVVDAGAVLLDAEGTFVPPPDAGQVRTAEDAVRLAAAVDPAATERDPAALRDAARAGFERTTAVLGVPVAPSAPPTESVDRFEPPERPNRPASTIRRPGRDVGRRGRGFSGVPARVSPRGDGWSALTSLTVTTPATRPRLACQRLPRVGDSLQSFGRGLLPDDALPPRGRLPHVEQSNHA